jgi:hypothetical protein
LEYHCRVLFKTSCITSGSHIKQQPFQIKSWQFQTLNMSSE